MFLSVRDGARDALAVLFPVDCAGCGAPDRALCAECRMQLHRAVSPHCEVRVLSDSTRVVSAVRYETQVRHMLIALKEQGRTDVVSALARPLRTAIELAAAGAGAAVEVCPVPASRQSRRRRGYRPVDALASSAGFRLARVIVPAVTTQQQKTLDLAHRGANLHGAFVASPAAQGRRFIIVDDVVTSGATLLEAARALREGGAEVVGAATLAFTPRRNARKKASPLSTRDIYRQGSYGG